MKRLLWLLILVGCATPPPRSTTDHDPILMGYVDYLIRDLPNVDLTNISVRFEELDSKYYGMCRKWSGGGREILVNSKHWNSMSSATRSQTLLHELGHCAYNLPHEEVVLLPDGCPNTVMGEYATWDSCYVNHYQEYITRMIQQKSALYVMAYFKADH